MILITGAGGKTGRALIKVLSNVESVFAFVHRAEQVPVAKSLGAQKVMVGDMRDETAIHSAMQGIRAVYHVCPNMSPDEVVIGRLVIGEARKAGVEHFVYHSVLHPQTEKMNHHWQKLRVEEVIFESGLPFTILQPAPYMQNLLGGWKGIVEDGVLRVPYSIDSKFSFIDLEDLAEAAMIVLTGPGHIDATYELVGTLPMSHVEVAEILSRVVKRDVRAEKEETRDWGLRAQQSGMSGYALENLIRMFDYYDQWGLGGKANFIEPGKEYLMTEKIIEKLFEHNNWANMQIIQACSRLTDEQLDAEPQSATHGSIRSTLSHLVTSQRGYLALLTLPVEKRPNTPLAFEELQESARTSGEGLLALIRDEHKFPQDRLQTRDGYTVEPWVVMLQIINHATEHREQIKSMLSSLGITPPDIDGWDYGLVTNTLVPIPREGQ